MRIVCRTCGGKWGSRCGTISAFIEEHERLHELQLPLKLLHNEKYEDYSKRQKIAYREYFKDSRQEGKP